MVSRTEASLKTAPYSCRTTHLGQERGSTFLRTSPTKGPTRIQSGAYIGMRDAQCTALCHRIAQIVFKGISDRIRKDFRYNNHFSNKSIGIMVEKDSEGKISASLTCSGELKRRGRTFLCRELLKRLHTVIRSQLSVEGTELDQIGVLRFPTTDYILFTIESGSEMIKKNAVDRKYLRDINRYHNRSQRSLRTQTGYVERVRRVAGSARSQNIKQLYRNINRTHGSATSVLVAPHGCCERQITYALSKMNYEGRFPVAYDSLILAFNPTRDIRRAPQVSHFMRWVKIDEAAGLYVAERNPCSNCSIWVPLERAVRESLGSPLAKRKTEVQAETKAGADCFPAAGAAGSEVSQKARERKPVTILEKMRALALIDQRNEKQKALRANFINSLTPMQKRNFRMLKGDNTEELKFFQKENEKRARFFASLTPQEQAFFRTLKTPTQKQQYFDKKTMSRKISSSSTEISFSEPLPAAAGVASSSSLKCPASPRTPRAAMVTPTTTPNTTPSRKPRKPSPKYSGPKPGGTPKTPRAQRRPIEPIEPRDLFGDTSVNMCYDAILSLGKALEGETSNLRK